MVAKKFWQNVLEIYTQGNFIETAIEDNGWDHIVRSFDNANKISSLNNQK